MDYLNVYELINFKDVSMRKLGWPIMREMKQKINQSKNTIIITQADALFLFQHNFPGFIDKS